MSQLHEEERLFQPPQAPFAGSTPGTPTPQQSDFDLSTPHNSAPLLIGQNKETSYLDGQPYPSTTSKRRRPFVWFAAVAVLTIVVLAVILPIYFLVIKPKQNHTTTTSSDTGDSSGNTSGSQSSAAATTGGDGSTITTEDGTRFTYKNQFGGFWVDDPNDPFNNNARPNSWTPPLNTSWTWGKDKIYGVNLGGWLVLEPFISPALFQKYPGAIDEWTLSEAMAADTANGGLGQIEDHYKTFITEQDIAEIAGAGLNWVRVPIPFWAIDAWAGEPFLVRTSWTYFLKLVKWCRKYGIRINLDLHTIPGSQNGYNHSGKDGIINFLNGVMGIANAQRTLNYIRIITEFISQKEYRDVIPMFGIMNEALLSTIGQDQLTSFYLEVHTMIRDITGIGEGNGPFISIHDGFGGDGKWAGFLQGSDRIALDTHPHFAFDGSANSAPIATGTGANAGGVWPAQACNAWGDNVAKSQSAFGFTFAGEFSSGYNDCGLFLIGVGNDKFAYGDCTLWMDSTNWNDTVKAGLLAFTEASMDTLQHWFYWTWKIGNSTVGIVQAPLWSYSLGLQNGWIPTDPRTAEGKCQSVGAPVSAFGGTYESWQTGGAGAGTIVASSTSLFPFPPGTISNVEVAASLLPTYVPTGTVSTLPPPTLTPSPTQSVDVGNGWFDAQDTSSAYTVKAGCTYPNPWSAVGIAIPTQC